VTSYGENIYDLEPLVVLTGAGISAESGIPTFRGDHGLWREFRAEALATPEAFQKDPELVWEFYDWRRQIVTCCSPNPAYQILIQIEQSIQSFNVITQNVDGFHALAGNKHVIELHGSLWDLKCTTCGSKWRDLQVPLPQLPPQCPTCNGLARPDVVWFGESLDPLKLSNAHRSATNARTMLVIGTSALVQPASLIPLLAKDAGARVIEFNLEPTTLTPYVDENILGPVGQTLPAWWNQILENSEK
jgi:NAD-dependent deacetylase